MPHCSKMFLHFRDFIIYIAHEVHLLYCKYPSAVFQHILEYIKSAGILSAIIIIY